MSDEEHRHGATPNGLMVHLAINEADKDHGVVVWLPPVDEELHRGARTGGTNSCRTASHHRNGSRRSDDRSERTDMAEENTLNNGVAIPALGLGVLRSEGAEVTTAVSTAPCVAVTGWLIRRRHRGG